MADWLQYLLESSLCLLGFGTLYLLVFRNLSHLRWNRVFFLLGLGLALGLPLLTVEVDLAGQWAGGSAWMDQVVRSSVAEPAVEAVVPVTDAVLVKFPGQWEVPAPSLLERVVPSWPLGLLIVWLGGVVLMGARLGRRLYHLYCLGKNGNVSASGFYRVCVLPVGSGNFSFGRTVFLDAGTWNGPDRETVLAHEMAHLQQGHSLDILFFDWVHILFWFHPLMGRLRRELQTLHEYLADAAAGGQNPVHYSRMLLQLALAGPSVPPSHGFARSQIRRRIQMLTQNPSHPMSKIKYALMLPLLGLFSLAFVVSPAVASPEPAGQNLTFAGEAVHMDDPEVALRFKNTVSRISSQSEKLETIRQRVAQWRPRILPLLAQEGVHEDFFFLAVAESHLDPKVKSSMGALGMWQMMPKTAVECGLEVTDRLDQRLEPEASTLGAARYLKSGYDAFGSWIAAAAAYNQGIPAIQKLLKVDGTGEQAIWGHAPSRNYLLQVLAMKQLIGGVDDVVMGPNPPKIHPFGKGASADVTAGFGYRKSPFSQKEELHKGIDLRADEGTPVYAPAAGTVEVSAFDEAHGNRIVIKHDNRYTTSYSHLADRKVKAGDRIPMGQRIGSVGTTGKSTGPHLHYEVHEDGKPVDPAPFMK